MAMSQFYSTEQTDSSRRVLGELLALVPGAVLIGGWASWVRTGGPMSHDIDLIVSRLELSVVADLTGNVSLSTHIGHKKWRATYHDVHVDLYVPYESRLGQHLSLRVEDLANEVELVSGYNVLTIPAHIATKWAALMDRPDSLPGEKDRFEIRTLLELPDANRARAIILASSSRSGPQALELIERGFDYLREERNITTRQRAAINRQRQLWAQLPSSRPSSSLRPQQPTWSRLGTLDDNVDSDERVDPSSGFDHSL